MNVSEAVDMMREAELKQLSIKDDKKAIMGFLNLGILELYKRFNLWEAEAIITMVTGTTLYTLLESDPNVSIDLSDHQLLMVEQIFDELGEEMVLNDELDADSLTTPKYNQVEVVEETDGALLSVVYRAAPVFLVHEKQEIPLPPQFFEALFHYVGYRGHGSVKGDLKSENNSHYQRFDKSCDNIEFHGLFIQDDLQSTKFQKRGFV